MIKQGICQPSSSYAAPCFLVEQPFHDTSVRRLVVDFSKTINPLLVADPQPIDNMDDVMFRVAGKKYKFKADVAKAFNSIPIHPDDIHKTAFVTPDGHYEFRRLPFGVSIGPATMTRAVKLAYAHLLGLGVSTYIDDVSFGTNVFQDHAITIRHVFVATRRACFKLSPKKLVMASDTISLFGRLLLPDGIVPDPERTAAVTQYRPPTTIHELRSFLGFLNYFRAHIQNLSSISRPLTDLLKGVSSKASDTKSRNRALELTETHIAVFNNLKELVTSPPVLAYFVPGVPTFVETDASYKGLGAFISQDQQGHRVVIQYASRSLKDAETRYHSNELECAAVHWAITAQFHLYLHGQPFTLVTDNFTTAYILAKSKINRKFARYVVDLSQYTFVVQHRPGTANVVADHLSRYPLEPLSQPCATFSYTPSPSLTPPVCTAVLASPEQRILHAQTSDSYCKHIIASLNSSSDSNHARQLRRVFSFDDGILLRLHPDSDPPARSIVVPQNFRSETMRLCHDGAGHMDSVKTTDRIRRTYWWPKLARDVTRFVRSCHVCQLVNRRTTKAFGLLGDRPIPHTPFEVVSADHLVALPLTRSGNRHIIVTIDHATRYLIARATPTVCADTVVTSLECDIIHRYGPPHIYISDNGPAFVSKKAGQAFRKYGITHSLTPPYTPQANGLVERANATLIAALKKTVLSHPQTWDITLPLIVLALNTTIQSTTQFTPFFLLHGFEPRLPKQLHLGSYVSDIPRLVQLDELSVLRHTAEKHIKSSHAKAKLSFDQHRRDVRFSPGTLVTYDWPSVADHKLSPRFKGPFRVLRPVGAVCYKIQLVNDPTVVKTVHVQALKEYITREKENTRKRTEDEPLQDPIEEDPIEEQMSLDGKDNNKNGNTANVQKTVNDGKRIRKRPSYLKDYVL